jgi:hypothetical protein
MDKEIILKTWEVYQGLVQGMGDTCWKLRSLFYTASSALIAYGFVHSITVPYVLVTVLSIIFFLLEAGYKDIQNQYIQKSLEIERTLNDLLVNEPEPFIPPGGISTSIAKLSMWRYRNQLRMRKILFWGPYFLFLIVSLILWL